MLCSQKPNIINLIKYIEKKNSFILARSTFFSPIYKITFKKKRYKLKKKS